MTLRQDYINVLAWQVWKLGESGKAATRAACELMDENALCGYIGRWYRANVEGFGKRYSETAFWSDFHKELRRIYEEDAEYEAAKARQLARAGS